MSNYQTVPFKDFMKMLRKRGMKPHLRRGDYVIAPNTISNRHGIAWLRHGWVCEGQGIEGFGVTPKEAYVCWRGRLPV